MLCRTGLSHRPTLLSGTSRQLGVAPVASLLNRMAAALSGARPLATKHWWTKDTVAVVTGANKGIGWEVARLLAENGMTVVLAARSEELGLAALKKLQELPVTQGSVLVYHQLDITQPGSITAFTSWLQQQYGRLDILVNNAGFAYKGDIFGADEAGVTLATNYSGTRQLTEALLPLMKEGGRIVNVSSSAGQLRIIPDVALRQRFADAPSAGAVDELAASFVAAIRAGNHKQQGWPSSMYGISKVCVSAWSRVLAAQLKERHISVTACCPGYCATDMSSWRGTQSAAAGADTPAWLALLPPADALAASGTFWRDRAQQAW